MKLTESETSELKLSWQDTHLKTISAFANTSGGRLIVGVEDSGKPIGKLDIKKLLEDIPNKIITKCGLLSKVYSKTIASKKIIVIEIEKSEAPISYNGKFFTRIGSTTQALQGKDLTRFLIEKSVHNWDEYPAPEASVDQIKTETIQLFKEKAKERLPFVKEPIALTDLLEKLNLISDTRLKRAAVLLFSESPKQFFTSAYLRIGKFNKEGLLISSDTVEGNLFTQVENTIELLKVKYLIATVKVKGMYRTEVLEIPEWALREAIINALIHRNYVGAHTQIKIYPDKLIIWNDGGLPKPLTVNDLKKIHPSRPRNDLLADIFFKAGLIETWGQGTIRMIRSCLDAGLPEPRFREEFGGLSVSFSHDFYTDEYLDELDINHRQKEITKHLKDESTISNSQYQALFSVSKPTATQELGDLVNKSILKREGKRGAGTVYRLIY